MCRKLWRILRCRVPFPSEILYAGGRGKHGNIYLEKDAVTEVQIKCGKFQFDGITEVSTMVLAGKRNQQVKTPFLELQGSVQAKDSRLMGSWLRLSPAHHLHRGIE